MGPGAHAVRPGGDRSWLLIKHRDEWSGAVDVTQFALSVKSNGDFADILAEDHPDIWRSHRPAQGGATGALFAKIIERAQALSHERVARERAGTATATEPARPRAAIRKKTASQTTKRASGPLRKGAGKPRARKKAPRS